MLQRNEFEVKSCHKGYELIKNAMLQCNMNAIR